MNLNYRFANTFRFYEISIGSRGPVQVNTNISERMHFDCFAFARTVPCAVRNVMITKLKPLYLRYHIRTQIGPKQGV